MCYDLNEYDPFEPIYMLDFDGELELDTKPMNEYDWEEWLDSLSLDV